MKNKLISKIIIIDNIILSDVNKILTRYYGY